VLMAGALVIAVVMTLLVRPDTGTASLATA
jgi:hypothetical protein